MKPLLRAFLALGLCVSSQADNPVSTPVIGFATGLPGTQVHLEWNASPGVRYRIEKSSDLGAGGGGGGGGGSGGWSQVAVVVATTAVAQWTDPIPTETRAFYRIRQPQPEVYGVAEPVLSPTGGALVVHGQCIPDGSFLMLEFAGSPPVYAALVSSGPGQWTAIFGGPLVPGANLLSAAVTNGLGTVIAPVDVDISITENGLATDAPPSSLPPSAPVPDCSSNPIPGVGVVIKRNPGPRSVTRKYEPEDCDDLNDVLPDPYTSAVAMPGSKGRCQWDNGPYSGDFTGAQTNPAFTRNQAEGKMPEGKDPLFRLLPGRNGIPGEVSLEYDALSLSCPAGPAILWTMTYRSMVAASSGHGAGWVHSCDVYVVAPPASGTCVIYDGAGRADKFRLGADGSYRADGFSRVGHFSGNVFTLTFANGGKWIFHAHDGSPVAGKLQTILDPNGNAVTCNYDGAGKISSISSAFGQSIAVTWTGDRISSITDHTGRSVFFSYFGALESGGPEGDLKSISCPVASGQGPLAGPTTFTYSSGTGTPRLDHNLLSVTDGAGRVLESFTYATTTDPTDYSFDTLVTHSAHDLGHNFGMCHDGPNSFASRVVYLNDEVGRVTVAGYDKMHRLTRVRHHTGFHPVPGGPVTAADFPLPGKLRTGDPDYFESHWTYNVDSNVTSVIGPDGSKMLTTYQRDLDSNCPVIARGNARVQTLVSSLGESRTITMEHQPNSGTPENARPGSPIGGLSIKGGRNPGGPSAYARPGNPIKGISVKGGRNPSPVSGSRRRVEVLKSNKQGDPNANRGITINTSHVEYATANRLIWSPRSNINDPKDDDCDGLLVAFLSKKGYDYYQAQSALQSAFLSKKGYDYYQAQSALQSTGSSKKGYDYYQARKGGLAQAQTNPAFMAGGEDEDCDGESDEDFTARPGAPIKGISVKGGRPRPTARLMRLTTSHGQSFTWTYDNAGNLTSAISPVPGKGVIYQYDAQGRVTSSTRTNGAAGSFHDTYAYGADGFLQTCTQDATPGGRNLATTFEYDALGRTTRVVDPMGSDWLLTWNPLDLCTRTESPPVAGHRIATDFAYDASGRLARLDVELRDPSGNLDPSNSSYSTFWVYDSRGRLVRVAEEERPTDTTGLLEPNPLTIQNFAVRDLTYDHAGQVIRLSTPAACRGQISDSMIDLAYDERGLLYHTIAGGSGNPVSVTTEFDYDTLGACVREATMGPGGGATLYAYDAFHRLASVTDAMGNQSVFTYDETGRVTTSVFGEVNDVAGSTGNVLLARTTTTDGGGGRGTIQFGWILWTDAACSGTPNRHYGHVDCPSRAARVSQPDRPVRGLDGNPTAFFAVYQEDDVIVEERFSAGQLTPHATETTLIDRSPAGLVLSVSRNGDVLDSYGYDSSGALTSISNAARVIDLDRDGRQDVVICGMTEHFLVVSPPTPKTYSHTITRDALGRITALTDGAGNASVIAYDSMGRIRGMADPGRQAITFAYDGSSTAGDFSVAAACDINGTGTPESLGRYLLRSGVPVRFDSPTGYSTSFTCDALDRVTRCDNPDGTYSTIEYDPRGFPQQVRSTDGTVGVTTFDPLGREITFTRINLQLGSLAYEDMVSSYDGLGRPVSVTQGTSTVAMTWDSLGNPTSETSGGLTITRAFNHRGRTSVTYPDTTSVAESRNEFGQLTSAGGNLIHYVGSRVYQTVQTNGVTTTYAYRGNGDSVPPGDSSYGTCTRVTTTAGTATLADCLIQHFPDQRVKKSRTLLSADPAGPTRVRTFECDGLGRVTACLTERREVLNGPVVTESDVHYTLDAAGRRLTVTGGPHPGNYTQSATAPPADAQMGQYTTWPGGNLEWDDIGNLTTFHNGPNFLDFDSDNDGRVVAVNDGGAGTPIVHYTYDAVGRLASRTEYSGALPPATTVFVWDGPHLVQELDDPNGTGDLSAALTFVCDDSGLKHCISTRNGTLYYPMNENSRRAPASVPRAAGLGMGLSGANASVLEFYDQDEAGGLVLLDNQGISKTTEIGPVRWMAPESMRDRATGFVHGSGCVYSPLLGAITHKEKPKPKPTKSSSHELKGHVTLFK